MSKKVKGFTLVELVISIAIIAILVSIAVPQFNKARISAIASTHNSNVQSIKSAAVLASIETEDTTLTEKCAEYIEGGKLPDIPSEISKALSISNWSITKNNKGDIEVKPGLVEVVDGEIKSKD